MKKAKEIKLVFVIFFVGSVLILSSSAWLPLFTVEKSVIDLIKEDLTLKEDTLLLEVIENYSDISAPTELDKYKSNFLLYSSDKESDKTYAKFLNEVIVRFANYRDVETDKDKIVLYKDIVNELIGKYDFVESLKGVSTGHSSSTFSNGSLQTDNQNENAEHDDRGNNQNVELPDELKE